MFPFVKLREYAQEHDIPIISPKTQQILKNLLSIYRPISILEIWSAIGYSTLMMAHHLTQYTTEGMIYSFEISLNAYLHLLSNLNHFKEYLPVIKPFNIDFLSYPSRHLPLFDFIFIDAQKSLYVNFLKKSISHLKPGWIIIIDDVGAFPTKTDRLWNYLKQTNLNFEMLPAEQNDKLLIIKF